MPATVKAVNGFQVRTPKGVKAKRTTLRKAKAQQRLLNAIEHNPDFKPRKKKKKKGGRS